MRSVREVYVLFDWLVRWTSSSIETTSQSQYTTMQHNDLQYYYKPFFIPKWSKINDNYYYNTNNYGYIQELWYTRNKEITTKNHCSLIFNHIPYLTNNPGHFLQVLIIFGYLYNFLLFKWKENNLDKCGYFFSLNNSKSMINVISNLYSDIKKEINLCILAIIH